MSEATLTRCHCGNPLVERGNRSGEGLHMRCDHCDRPCKGNKDNCERCKQSHEWGKE